jgi:hypothetical protein
MAESSFSEYRLKLGEFAADLGRLIGVGVSRHEVEFSHADNSVPEWSEP